MRSQTWTPTSALTRTNLDSDQRLDAHLIANSVMLTEQIARWNLIRDLTPMVADDDRKEL